MTPVDDLQRELKLRGYNSHHLSACIGTAGILHDVLKPWFFGSGVNSLEIGLRGRLVRRPDSGLGT
jgi:hypothetical protein